MSSLVVSRAEWIEKYGGGAQLVAEGMEVVPCTDCDDAICHGWRVQKAVVELEEGHHRYTVNGRFVPSVTQVLEAAGRINLQGIPEHVLWRAALRGTRVHQAAALLLQGVLDWATVDDAIGGYVRALDTFLRVSGFRPEPDSIEQRIYCPEFDYCGTSDVCGDFPNPRSYSRRPIRAVVDWKSGMMPAVQYQLAGYAHPLGLQHRAAVKLNSDGTYGMSWFSPETLRHDFDTFRRDLEQTRSRAWEPAA